MKGFLACGVLVLGVLPAALLATPVHLLNVWADDASLLDVQVVHADGAATDAKSGQDLGESDRLRTGYKSHARLDFGGKATVVVEELSEFKVGVFKLGKTSQVELWLKSGEIQAQVRREAAARTEFSVRTPTATASVRGTKINSILYTPQSGMQIAMGNEGSLHATTKNGSTVAIGANQNAKEDTQSKTFIDDAHLRLDNSRTLVTPSGLDRREQEVAKLNTLTVSPTLSLGSTGTSQSPVAPSILGLTLPGVLIVDGGSDPGIAQNLQKDGFSPVVTSNPGALAGNLSSFAAVLLLKTDVSAYLSQLQAFHDSNRGVLFDGSTLIQSFNFGVPAYLGGGISGYSGVPPVAVTALGSQFTGGAVPAGTSLLAQPNNPAIGGGSASILASYTCGCEAVVFNNDGKGRAAFVAIQAGSSSPAMTLTQSVIQKVAGRQ